MKLNIEPFKENLIYHVVAGLALSLNLDKDIRLDDRVGIIVASALEARIILSEVARKGPQAFSDYAISDVRNGCIIVAGMLAVAMNKYLGISEATSKEEYARRYDDLRAKSAEIALSGKVRPSCFEMLMAIKHGHSDHDPFTGEYKETSAGVSSVIAVSMHSRKLGRYFETHGDEVWNNSQSLGVMICAHMAAYIDICKAVGENEGQAIMFDRDDMAATQPTKPMSIDPTVH